MAGNKSCEGKIYKCVNCFSEEVVKDDIKMDGRTCKKCGGHSYFVGFAGIDYGSSESKSIGKLTIDASDTIKGLKAIQREAKKATAALKELEEQKKDKYLVIELDELGDVPRVFYKGKEINMKEFINFQWQTRTDSYGYTDIIVDYYEKPTKESVLAEKKSIREGVSS